MMLSTPRCTLISLQESDIEALIALRTHEEVRRFLGGPLAHDLARSRLSALIQPDPAGHVWTVRVKSDMALMGLLSLDPHHDGMDWEISYEFFPEWWGQGYAYETVSRVVEYAFRELGHKRVVAETQAANSRSIRLLERLGFEAERVVQRFGEEQLVYGLSKP